MPSSPDAPTEPPKSRKKSPGTRPPRGVGRGAVIPTTRGKLIAGAGRGPQKGTGGRPPSILRSGLTEVLERGIPEIEKIARGDLVHKTRVRVADLSGLLECANCGEASLVLSDPENHLYTTVESLESASPRDRLKAYEVAGTYGPGAVKQISMETVRDKVQETLNIIRAHVTPEVFETMKPELRAAWA